MKRFIGELQRRNVIRTGTAYAVSAWVILQVATVVFPPLGVPTWVMTMTTTLALAGFPLSLIFAWWLEWTSEGLKTHAVAEAEGLVKESGFGRLIDFVIIALLVFAVGWMVVAIGSARLESARKQAQAEEMIRFMVKQIGDSQDHRGNMRILDSMGSEILEYYGSLDPADMSMESLALRSRAFHMVGNIENMRGNFDLAEFYFRTAYGTTAELLDRQPENTQRIFDHIQSSFYLGELAWRMGDYASADSYFIAYRELANRLVALEGGNLDWQGEVGFANSNLGTLYQEQGEFAKAIEAFSLGRATFEKIVAFSDNPGFWQRQLAQAQAWLADAHMQAGHLSTAMKHRTDQRTIYEAILAEDPGDLETTAHLMRNFRALAELSLYQGHVDQARSYLEEAILDSKALLTFGSENASWRASVGFLELDYAELLIHARKADAAAEALARAERIIVPLMDANTPALAWKVNLESRAKLLKAQLMMNNGDRANALELTKAVVAGLEELRRSNPTDQDVVQFLCLGSFLIGEAYASLDQPQQAARAWRATTERVSTETRNLNLRTREIVAMAYTRLGEREAADRVRRPLDDMGYAYPGFSNFTD